VFENVATNYDKMNDAMSMGVHRIWKDIFMCRLGPTANTNLLDMAGGTGNYTWHE
jgi:2-methoxy-6-polyprenyl-1,4-benzoquinol methylase